MDSLDGSDARRVGVPVHELHLIATFRRSAASLYKPGPGRVSYVLFEPEVGAGRPDAVAITVSRTALDRFMSTGLRVRNVSESRALFASDASPLGLTAKHSRSLKRHLAARGWTISELERASSIVYDSLAVEAKIRDWQQALRQAAKFSIAAHQAALFMPVSAATRIPRPLLTSNGFGLVSSGDRGASWEVLPERREPAPYARLWLLELLLRGLESGTAHTPSALRKREIASMRDSTLGR